MAENQEKPLLGIPTPIWNSLIAAVMTCVLSYMSLRTQQQVKDTGDKAENAVISAEKAADKVRTTLVKTTKESDQRLAAADEKLDSIAATSDKTHLLVNSAMGAQLRVNAELARSKADLSKDPIDETAAELAEQALKDHQAKQRAVDEQSKQK